MGSVPSIESSIHRAFERGFNRVEKAAQAVTEEDVGNGILEAAQDLMRAKIDVGAGSVLLKTYRKMMGGLLDVLA